VSSLAPAESEAKNMTSEKLTILIMVESWNAIFISEYWVHDFYKKHFAFTVIIFDYIVDVLDGPHR